MKSSIVWFRVVRALLGELWFAFREVQYER